MPTELRWCPRCRDERLFETPPCLDGHGFDCPERACLDCGSTVFVGPLIVADPVPRLAVSAAA